MKYQVTVTQVDTFIKGFEVEADNAEAAEYYVQQDLDEQDLSTHSNTYEGAEYDFKIVPLDVAQHYGLTGSNDSVEDTIAQRDALLFAIGEIEGAEPTQRAAAILQASALAEAIQGIVDGEGIVEYEVGFARGRADAETPPERRPYDPATANPDFIRGYEAGCEAAKDVVNRDAGKAD